MNMNFDLKLTQEQKLIMTQEMQLSVKLLQMSSYELQQYVEKELQENPVLDAKEMHTEKTDGNTPDYKELIKYFEFDNYSHRSYEKDDEEVSPFTFISAKKTLKEYVKDQVIEINESKYIKSICEYIIESLDSRGYFPEDISSLSEELGIPEEILEKALKIVQFLEPDGIGARNINECLKIQASKKGIKDENVYKIIDSYLELLAENKFSQIAKEIGVDNKKAQEYGDIIKSLEPKPSRGFYTGDEVKYVIPDAYLKKIDGEYYIVMNEDLAPKLTINNMYKEIIKEDTNKEAVEYVKDRLNSALFLIKSIEHRKSTIYRVIEKLLELQRDYFDYGEEYLKPMTLKEIADSLEVHESTVSRAIREKYIYTSRGTVRLKDIFTVGLSNNDSGEDISTRTIKSEIKTMIDKEDKHNPLSDQNICDMLNDSGMNISRRTVAKYREELGIKSSKGRKRF
jgi:RNA polymerase sigma-54 factor